MKLNGISHKVIFIAPGIIVVILITSVLYLKGLADRNFWTDPTCLPPCWNDIRPGNHANTDEIIHFLTRNSTVSEIWENRLPGGTSIAWYWKQLPWQRTGASSIFLVGNEVDNISLSVAFDLTVQEIMDHYGIPENTDMGRAGVPEHPYVRVSLIFPTKGVTFVAAVTPWDKPNLQPMTRITEAIFYVPSDLSTAWQEANPNQHLCSWPGYGLLEASEPCLKNYPTK